MLKLKNVSKYYYQDGVIAAGFTKVNLELHLGEFVVITGESGSGKSTLLNVLSGLDTYEDGEMFINGEETSHYTEENYLEYRRKYVSNIFQNFNLVNSYTVYENIELALLMNGKTKRSVKKQVDDLIEKVGLTKYRNMVTSKLSGGQKQRVAIARALANDTPIIVADEPTGSLDSKASKEIILLLHEISKEKLVIVVTHNKEEIENYATRLIRMHDGKILENKVINKINLDNSLKAQEVKNITEISKTRLGIRNAFNIPTKFLLMIAIFLLITVTLISTYGILKNAEYEESGVAYNNYFLEQSDKRVILSKKNKEIFNAQDYEKIANLKNIAKVVENDLINDYEIYLASNAIYLSGTVNTEKITKVDLGRLPEKENEVVIAGSKDSYYLKDIAEVILNETFAIENISDNSKYKIVGIIYENDNDNPYQYNFYLNKELENIINTKLEQNYIMTSLELNGYTFNERNGSYVPVKILDSIKSGEVYISDSYNNYCANYVCKNNNLSIKTENIYFKDKIDLKITEVYNTQNAKNILGISYENADNAIYLNASDYEKLFRKGNYQSSVFVKELKDLDSSVEELQSLGYNTLKVKDAKQDDLATLSQIFKIFRLIVIVTLIVVLFFISYFIIKIIFKSRNSYYTTLRTLGSTKMVCINILMKELLMHATFAYCLFLGFIYAIKMDFIKYRYFKEVTKYIGVKEYLLVYLILLLLSILMSYRYGRKIFKNSIIKTYGERI